MRSVWFAALSFAAALIFGMTAEPAFAARKAFIVGNANYLHTNKLTNPANDARDLAARLTALKYDVTLEIDVGRTQFLSSFQKFSQSLQADDLALVYFAGHGLQIGGENYLFPIDARVEKEADARTNLVPLNSLLADLTRITRSRILILDACRNNPFAEELARGGATRSAGVTQGLARVYAGVGSFIVFSTQPGNVALDGTGRNSPFTDALLRHMPEPGADVHAVMRRVRADVGKATADRQVPWENSSLVDEVAFAGGNTVVAAAPSDPGALPKAIAQPKREPGPAINYSYVTGLDPKGDNFLALRSTPAAEGVRIATMGPDTLLKVIETRGPWRRIELTDGATGWAHSNWIACCRPLVSPRPSLPPTPTAAPSPLSRPTIADTCDSLWTRRNAIWHRHGYCFTGARGQQTFGNAGCSRDEASARAVMSAADRSEIDALTAREKAMNCR
jgi:hypothetical protein